MDSELQKETFGKEWVGIINSNGILLSKCSEQDLIKLLIPPKQQNQSLKHWHLIEYMSLGQLQCPYHHSYGL